MGNRTLVVALALAVPLAFAVLRGAIPARGESRPTPALDRLVHRSQAIREYSATIQAHEADGDRVDDRVLRFTFSVPDHATLEATSGKGAGMTLVWSGGTRVRVRGGLFSILPVWLDLHDPRITSLRGNTMLRAQLGPALHCFEAHRDDVTEGVGPPVDGHPTDTIALAVAGGLRCPADSARDGDVTKDVLTVTQADSKVVRRERYVGSTLVERWVLSDVVVVSGPAPTDPPR